MATSKISGITIEINGETSQLTKALSEVNKEIKQTSSDLKDVEKLLKLDPSNTELLTQKQKLLSTEIADTKEKLDTMKTASDQANEAMQNGAEVDQRQYDALQREIIATEQQLKSLCDQAAEANQTLQKIGEVGDTLQNVGSKVTSVGETLTKSVTVPLAAIGTAAVSSASQFESAMAEVQAISGATADEMDMLGDAATEMSNNSVWSATECAEAMKYMGLAGWDAQDMISGLPGILNLATAANMDLSSASDIVTDYLTAFGLSAQDCEGFVDQLAYAMSNSNTDVEQLGEAYKKCAASGTQLGFSLEDITAALMVSADAGIKGGSAGTALASIMTRLANNTSGCRDVLSEYGVECYDAEGNVNSLSSILEGMKGIWADLSDEEKGNIAYTIAGKNAQSELMTILGESTGTFNEYLDGLTDCNGAAQDMADIMSDTLSGQTSILKNQIENLGRSFGEILLPMVQSVVEWIQGLVTKFNDLDEGTKETIVQVGLVAAAIGPLLTVLGTLTSTVGKVLSKISDFGTSIYSLVLQTQNGIGPISKLTTAIGGISAPVVAVAAVVGTLVAAFTTLWNTNEDFRNSIIEIWENIKTTVGDFIQGVIDRINDLGFNFESIGDIVEAIKQVWLDFCNVIAPVFEGAFQAVSNAISFVTNNILSILDIFIGLFTGDWEQFWNGISEFVTNIWNTICSFVENIVGTIWNIIGNILGLINADWQEKWNSIGDFLSNIWETIKTTISNALSNILGVIGDTVGNVISAITDCMNNIKETVTNIAKQALQWGKDLVSNIAQGIKDGISKVTDAVKGVADKIKSFLHFSVPDEGPLTDIASWMPDMIDTLASGISDGTAIIENAVNTLTSTAVTSLEAGLSGMVASAQSFAVQMNTVWQTWLTTMQTNLTTSFTNITSTTQSFLQTMQTNFQTTLQSLSELWTQRLTEMQEKHQTVTDAILNTTRQFLMDTLTSTQEAFTELMEYLDQCLLTIQLNVETTLQTLLQTYTTAMQSILPTTQAGFEPAIDYIKALIPQAYQWATDFMDQYIQGIKDKMSELEDTLERMADMVSDYLHFSHPEKGPLADYEKWMPDFMAGLAEGIEKNKSLITDQMKSLSSDMSIMAQGAQTNNTINLTSTAYLELDGKQIATSVDKYLGVTYG